MNLEEYAPIPPARLKRMRWEGERTYRLISHSFVVRWNRSLMADRFDYILGGFRVLDEGGDGRTAAGSNGPPVYSLIDLGTRYRRRYRLLLGEEQLISSRRPADVVNHLLWRILSRLKETNEVLLIHAGSVVTPEGDGVLLPADSGSGKTTLVAGLVRSGFKFLSDEVGVIDPRTGMLHPCPRALNFKEGGLRLFGGTPLEDGDDLWGRRQTYLRAEELRPDAMASPCRARYIIAPQYREDAGTEVLPLTPAATLKVLWANGINPQLYGPDALSLLAGVVRGASGYRLVSGDLVQAIQAVSEITRGSHTKHPSARMESQ